MAKNFVLIGLPNPLNRGGEAIVAGCVHCIRSAVPDAKMTLLSTQMLRDKVFENYGVELREHPWYRKRRVELLTLALCAFYLMRDLFNSVLGSLGLKNGGKVWFNQCEAIIDLTSDAFNDRYGSIRTTIYALLNIFLFQLVYRKPIIISPASIGPFSYEFTKRLAKLILNRVEVIAVRGEISKEYLTTIGVTKPRIFTGADLAFLLQPACTKSVEEILSVEGIGNSQHLVGITPNQELFTRLSKRFGNLKYEDYIGLMAEIAHYVVKNMDVQICLIPHNLDIDKEKDDREACMRIREQVIDNDKVKVILGDYEIDEIKGIIGRCEMFIGCRMHSTIAAVSMCVPTVAAAFGIKFYEVIGKIIGREECMIDIEHPNYKELIGELKSKVDYVWRNRDRIKRNLESTISITEEQALHFGRLLGDF